MALIPLSPSRLTPAAPSERGRLFIRGKGAAMSSTAAVHQHALRPRRTSAPTRDDGHTPSRTQAAQPTQERTGGTAAAAAPGRIYAPTRDTGQAPSRTQAAQPTQKRTGGEAAEAASGRIAAHTRDNNPCAQPNPKRRSQPKRAPAAKAAAAASGRSNAPTRD